MSSPFFDLLPLLTPAIDTSSDGSHDLSHLRRVWNNAAEIAREEGGDLRLLAAAVLLHDCVTVEKTSPLRREAARLAADRARPVLLQLGWNEVDTDIVVGAILTHSFSAGLRATSLEGSILQDADRLDAIGAVGIARCFYTAGRTGAKLYDEQDPQAERRPLDDKRFALDHFPAKLLTLAGSLSTATGRRIADERNAQLQLFYAAFLAEVQTRP